MSQSKPPKKTILSTVLALVAAAAAWWFGTGSNDGDTNEAKGATKTIEAPADPGAGKEPEPPRSRKVLDGSANGSGEAKDEPGAAPAGDPALARRGLEKISRAFRNKQSDVMVEGEAVVKFTLRDDNEGSRHQMWVCEFPGSPITVKFSHNIDLAPRVPLKQGDTIQFFGEYEYTEKGGVIHWTHHDPRGRHPDGWIRLGGETYQ